ncbi:MAG: hypothetical protein HS120_11205 [Burkholderiales bacterium]|nr:hypothetical protein [Burkholderiales bacterium]
MQLAPFVEGFGDQLAFLSAGRSIHQRCTEDAGYLSGPTGFCIDATRRRNPSAKKQALQITPMVAAKIKHHLQNAQDKQVSRSGFSQNNAILRQALPDAKGLPVAVVPSETLSNVNMRFNITRCRLFLGADSVKSYIWLCPGI